MLEDIVIDTNVLKHAISPEQTRQAMSIDLVNAVLSSTTNLCVDEGAVLDTSKNRSHIVHEYLKHIKPVDSFSYYFLTAMFSSGRFKKTPKKVSGAVGQFIL